MKTLLTGAAILVALFAGAAKAEIPVDAQGKPNIRIGGLMINTPGS